MFAVVRCYAGGVFDTRSKSGPSYNLTKSDDSRYPSGTVGNKYWRHLVGTHDPKNEAWWKEKYKEYETDKKDGKVSISVSHAYDFNENNTSSLNDMCNDLYKKYPGSEENGVSFDWESDKVSDPLSNSASSKYQRAGFILKYCSPPGTSLTNIQEQNK